MLVGTVAQSDDPRGDPDLRTTVSASGSAWDADGALLEAFFLGPRPKINSHSAVPKECEGSEEPKAPMEHTQLSYCSTMLLLRPRKGKGFWGKV